MRACCIESYGDYARLLDHDRDEYHRLVDALTVHVSRFFRDPEVWAGLEHGVLPELCRGRSSPLRVWSAGCAAGEEPFSASILLQQLAPPAGYEILGSDISEGALRAAALAEYSSFALTDASPGVCEHWFTSGPPFGLRPEARRHVRFVRADLLSDPPPAEQDLVLCRNVLIYLEAAQQEQLLHRLHQSLGPGGFLVLGKVEMPAGATARLFTSPLPRLRIFRKQ
jgi:chemotaxis methyl-accepting protein methylase